MMDLLKAFFMAWGNFCSIPCPWRPWDDNLRKQMLGAFPVLGLMLGIIWYGLFYVLELINIPVLLSAVILAIYPFFISGFMHLDGFMDCSDAICSRAPIEKKLEILKDSRVGAFAVIWVVVLFLLMFASMYTCLLEEGYGLELLIAIPVISRAVSGIAVLKLPRLGTSQYSSLEENNGAIIAAVAIFTICVIGAVTAIEVCNDNALVPWAMALQIVIQIMFIRKGVRSLGGMSGDISGYGISWSEVLAVFFIALQISY